MSKSTKSTENTVFVRFNPPSPSITRFHLQEIFGEVAPVKKCSIIRNSSNQGMGYGFCKFLSKTDAQEAYQTLNNKSVTVENNKYKLTVELASQKNSKSDGTSAAQSKQAPSNENNQEDNESVRKVSTDDTTTAATEEQKALLLAKKKTTNRVIVRNVSFYAKESHIRQVLEREFGPILEITLPQVSPKLHRGFCFCTFLHERDARRAVQPRQAPLLIKKRPVAIDYAVSKQQHEQQKKQSVEKKKHHEEAEKDDADGSSSSDDSSSSSSDDDSHIDDENMEETADHDAAKPAAQESDDDDSSSSGEEESSDNDDANDSDDEEPQDSASQPPKPAAPEHDDAVSDHRSLFLRNLPFDATRHDLFELFLPFGYIESIFLVKDKNTGVAKGTAFLAFRDVNSAEKALEAAGSSGFVSQRQESVESGDLSSGLQLRGRRLFVDVAVDKKTAASLTVEKQGNKVTGKDRRNLYLKMEGRVANEADGTSKNTNNAWENLPETDQLKRQRAFAEKNTKLRSPLFFINSKRLSIRNLAKHVDEAMLKKLCVSATRRGLDTKLVTQEDQIAHWRAGGDATTREIMKRIEATKQENGSVIPTFDERNIKRFIPSVYIDRDFSTNKKEKAPSRGFGFVDFEHHAHALACLRELNNNPYYSAEFVTGGKKAVDQKKQARKRKKTDLPKGEFVNQDGRALTPRLIVDFTVENKAKAKKQAEHRAQQQANIEKQRLELKEKKLVEGTDKKKQKKKSRGAIQREKKRKQRERLESGEAVGDSKAIDEDESAPTQRDPKPKVKSIKPPKKKRKVDEEEQNFENLVDSYRKAFTGVSEAKSDANVSAATSQSRRKKGEKRWFD